MQPSPPRLPSMFTALSAAEGVYGVIESLGALAADGRQAEALVGLSLLAEVVAGNRATLRSVIGAERQAAQGHDLTQRRDIRVLCCIGKPQPHPHAANSEHAPTPEQPSPSVA